MLSSVSRVHNSDNNFRLNHALTDSSLFLSRLSVLLWPVHCRTMTFTVHARPLEEISALAAATNNAPAYQSASPLRPDAMLQGLCAAYGVRSVPSSFTPPLRLQRLARPMQCDAASHWPAGYRWRPPFKIPVLF